MEPASIPFSEEQFLCSICLDVFTDPVTIPCGHNYCKTCIAHYWDSTNVCKCPQCNRTIYKGQEFSINTFISDVVRQYMRHKTDAELRRIRQYAVDVTLDPDTAHCKLILSEDGKRAALGDGKKLLPYNTKRFSTCGCVLAKQSFRSTRFYYEVQVGGKTAWSLGVARESIDRKVRITLNPNNGYWTMLLRNGHEYKAAAGPAVVLPVREDEVRKVGLFVDYEEGLVSFYDVEASVHLYSFTGCTFTEKLFPYFSPGVNDGGENSAPLIISPSQC